MIGQLRRLSFLGRSVLFVAYHRQAGAAFPLEAFAPEARFEIVEARHGERVRPNHAYYPWRDHDLEVVGGRLAVAPPGHRHHPNFDRLLRSLAGEYGPALTAALLSGMGDDGLDGLRAVLDAGGRVLVQDPAEAAFPQLPSAAVQRGLAHAVLGTQGLRDEVAATLRGDAVAPSGGDAGRAPAGAG